MKKLIAMLALSVLAQAVPGEESTTHQHRQVAQNQYYVATCSRNDLYLRFTNLGDARKAAADHARATGHSTGVIKE
ncbi:hypothetical protein IV102_25195 [bacterium]|nr:hypothetical protein [bacterium]